MDTRQLTGHHLTSAVFGAMAAALPDRVIADSGGPPTRIVCTPFPSNSGCGSFEAMESISPLVIWKKGRTVFQPGDVVRLRCAGEGGYGPSRERERTRILDDLKNELITPEAARTTYGLEV